MNMQTDGAQAPYDPGKPGIRWNVRPRDLHMLTASILVAGALVTIGLVWSAYIEGQATRCAAVIGTLANPQYAWTTADTLSEEEGGAKATDAGRAGDMSPLLRQMARAAGCDDRLLLGG